MEFTKLPLWATVKSAYRLAWENRGEYIQISRWWLMLAVPIVFAYNWLIWSSLQPSLCFATIKANVENHIPTSHNAIYLTQVTHLFTLFFGASIAVAWHRLILRNERITTDRYMRVDEVVWSYFAFGIFLWLIGTIPSLLFMLSGGEEAEPGTHIILGLIMAIINIATLVITIRLSVMLPAKALAVKEITIKDTWQRTRSNFWRLFIGMALCAIPVVIINMIIQSGCYADLTGVALFTISEFLYIIIVMPVALTFLSLSYQHFFESPVA